MSKANTIFMLWLVITCLLQAHASENEWQQERWLAHDFIQTLGGGPSTGPAKQTGTGAYALCGDSAGNIYLASGQFIDIITPAGMRYHLAGTGQPGYRDGPANSARFRLGFTAYYQAHNIACSRSGDLFVADGGNRSIRRVFQKEHKWYVETWAGGGSRVLRPGDSAPATQAKINGTIIVAARKNNEVVLSGIHGYYVASPDGKTITYAGRWPASSTRIAGKPAQLNVMMADVDEHDNVYFVSRTPDVVIKIDNKNRAQHIAGIVVRGKKPHHIGDTNPINAYFDTPTSITAKADGSAVYVCGGDEYDIRRVPTDNSIVTATLAQNGKWLHASVHPNRSIGAAVVKAGSGGHLRPEGMLTTLVVGHLLGRDQQGNLYGKIHHWRGMTQYIDQSGPLGTRIFKLHQVE